MMPTKRWKRTEYAEMWRWNGPEDNCGEPLCNKPYDSEDEATWLVVNLRGLWRIRSRHLLGPCLIVNPGDWIIDHGDRYEVISNAEFEAQGWEEGE